MVTNVSLCWFRKSLLFLCLTVGSVVGYAKHAEAYSIMPMLTEFSVTEKAYCVPVSEIEDPNAVDSYVSMRAKADYTTPLDLLENPDIGGNTQTGGTEELTCETNYYPDHNLSTTTHDGWYYGIFYSSDSTQGTSTFYYYEIFQYDATLDYGVRVDVGSTLNFNYGSGFFSTYNTRFTDISFTGKTLEATHFIDPDEVITSLSSRNPTQVQVDYAKKPSTDVSKIGEFIATTTGTSTTDIHLTALTNGEYDILVKFSNIGCFIGLSECPFPDAYVYLTVDITGSVVTVLGSIEYYDNKEEVEDLFECGLTEIDGCLKGAFSFLFVPSSQSVQSFVNLNNTASDKLPFAYFYDINELITQQSEQEVSTPTLVLTSPTSSPISYNVALISEAQMTSLLGSSALALFRTLIEISLWVSALTMVYYSSVRLFNHADV